MMNIIIYSKNRAMQLDACLRSLKKHFKDYNSVKKNVTVIYVASDEAYKQGYDKCSEEHSEVTFRKQTTFRVDTLESIDHDNDYTMFLVDDILFKGDFSVTDDAFKMVRNNDQMLALSLRLSPDKTYCYATDSNMRAPDWLRRVKGKFAAWRYHGCDGDWGYGLSLDGNVYNTKFIVPMLNRIDFHNPNELEANLNHPQITAGITPLVMCCYEDDSKLFNVPANRVQDTFNNRYEKSYSAKELNDKFLEGKRISLDSISGMRNISVHYPIEYEFK